MKALKDHVHAGGIIVLVEALTIGRRLGLDLDLTFESIAATSTGRNHPVEKKIIPQVISRRFSHGAALGLMCNDVLIARQSAQSAGARAPMAEPCATLWKEAEGTLGFNADQTEVARLWEKRTNVSLVSI